MNGDEATVKRVKKQPEGITLIATNTSVYEPHFYSNKEIADLPVRILGRAVELRTDPNRRILFDATKDLSKDDIDIVLNLINGLKAKEGKK